MQSAAQYKSLSPASGLTLVEVDASSLEQVVGVSAVWR